MQVYKKVYAQLGLTQLECDVALGREDHVSVVSQPAKEYGFPPALIPLWSADMSYVGAWVHWFNPGRTKSYVRLYADNDFLVAEIAKTCEQLFIREIISKIAAFGEVNNSVKEFCTRHNFDVAALSVHGIEVGDYEPELLSIPAFYNNAPLDCYTGNESSYSGEFPHKNMPINASTISNICSLEIIGSALRELITSRPECPLWLKEGIQKPRFDQLLSNGDLRGAWLCLNSSGWKFSEARTAIEQLAKRTDDNRFHAVAEAWCSVNHESYGFEGY